MANHASAKKRARQNIVRRAHNKSIITNVRGTIKDFTANISESSVDAAKLSEGFKAIQSTIMKAVSKGLIHKNTASRKIGRLAASMKKATDAK